jgi:hypothetical protein
MLVLRRIVLSAGLLGTFTVTVSSLVAVKKGPEKRPLNEGSTAERVQSLVTEVPGTATVPEILKSKALESQDMVGRLCENNGVRIREEFGKTLTE